MTVSRNPDLFARRARWLVLPVLFFALLVAGLLAPGSVSAHAELRGTDPADGAVLDAAPEVVTLAFNEAIEVVPEATQLYDADGLVGPLEATASGSGVEIALPDELEEGTYAIGWRVISADSHPVAGALTFSIGIVSGAPVDVEVTESGLVMTVMAIVTGIAYLSLLLAVGLAWFRVFLLRHVDPRSIRIAVWATVVTVISHLLLVPLTQVRDRGGTIGALVDLEMWKVGPLTLEVRALVFVVAGLIAMVAYMGRTPIERRVKWAVALGGLLALGSLTIVGHSTAIGPRWLMHGADFLHGAAGAFWFGGLIGLSLFLTKLFRRRSAEEGPAPGDVASVVAQFSFWAGLGVVGLALSGVVMAVRILGSWEALLHTTYGRLLIAKVLIVLLPLGLAAWNKFRLVPDVEREPDHASALTRLRTTVLVEAGLLVVILGVTGFLVLQNPTLPKASADVPAAVESLPWAETVELGDGTLYVRITPADTGENDVTIAVHEADDAPVELVADPQVRLSLPDQGLGPLTTELAADSDPGHYTGSVNVPVGGEWTIEVVTRVSKYEEPITTFEVMIPHTGEATPEA